MDDRSSEGEFKWFSGESLSYTAWPEGQPDNSTWYNEDGEDGVENQTIANGAWNDFPAENYPPVFLTFQTYHVMIGLGAVFALISLIGIILLVKNKLFDSGWYMKILLFAIPLPLLSNEMGWIAAEIGRQPWAVYNVLKTSDAVSGVVPAWQILLTIVMFTAVYLILFVFFIKFLVALIKKGPEKVISTEGY